MSLGTLILDAALLAAIFGVLGNLLIERREDRRRAARTPIGDRWAPHRPERSRP